MRRKALLVSLLALGCLAERSDHSRAGVQPSDDGIAQAPETLARSILGTEQRDAWEWVARRRSTANLEVPVHVAGRSAPVLVDGVTPYAATIAFVHRFRDVFQIVDPSAQLQLTREERDELGMTHVRLQQMERGVRVLGAEMMAHYDAHGSLRTIDSTAIPALDRLNLEPEISAAEAVTIAKQHFAAANDRTLEVQSAPELVIHLPVYGARKGTPALAYHFDLRAPDDVRIAMDYAVNARSGEVIESFNKALSLAGSGIGTQGDTKQLEISQDGSTFNLTDAPRHIATYDLEHKGTKVPGIGALMPGSVKLPGVLVTSNSATSDWDNAAVDAHFFAGITYDFYKTNFGRNGIDGSDGNIVSSVHVMKDWPNAQWDPNANQMLYGDGDGERIGPTSGSIDVVAHELTHGVTAATSKLTYAGQTGALNESISDVFGVLVEHSYRPDPVNNWGCAEDVLIGKEKGKFLRNFIHPHDAMIDQPAHMSEYQNTTDGAKPILDLGGVHINSGISNNAFYLMTMGGTNDVSKIEVKAGIGWKKAAQVWYRMNTKYLTSSSEFDAAAKATLSAADDLTLTQNEKNIIECAWIAVGVVKGDCATIVPQPPEAEETSGSDGGGVGASPVPTGTQGGAPPSTPAPGEEAAPGAHENGCSTGKGTASSSWTAPFVALALGALVSRRRRRAS